MLVIDISELQDKVKELEQRGGKIVFAKCKVGIDLTERLCIQVSEKQANIRNFKGSYGMDGSKKTFVVPDGY